jgi:hypothetical protein
VVVFKRFIIYEPLASQHPPGGRFRSHVVHAPSFDTPVWVEASSRGCDAATGHLTRAPSESARCVVPVSRKTQRRCRFRSFRRGLTNWLHLFSSRDPVRSAGNTPARFGTASSVPVNQERVLPSNSEGFTQAGQRTGRGGVALYQGVAGGAGGGLVVLTPGCLVWPLGRS